jgi:DNA-directed RNA polymerase specialized sigma24 family protein
MIEPPTSARTAETVQGSDRLNLLVDQIAGGDRAAFRCLYAFLAMRVWRDAVRILKHPADARAVTRSTFVEVWHLARHHVDHSRTDSRGWIVAIITRHIGERLRAPETPCPMLVDHDRHVHCELVALLGAGHATIRISPANFTRVDNLDLDLVTWPEATDQAPAPGVDGSLLHGVVFGLRTG